MTTAAFSSSGTAAYHLSSSLAFAGSPADRIARRLLLTSCLSKHRQSINGDNTQTRRMPDLKNLRFTPFHTTKYPSFPQIIFRCEARRASVHQYPFSLFIGDCLVDFRCQLPGLLLGEGAGDPCLPLRYFGPDHRRRNYLAVQNNGQAFV